MKKKQLFLSLLMMTSLFSFASCGNKEQGPSIPEIPWAGERTFLDESKLSGDMKTTTKVRVHYTREMADYDDWDIWA